MKKAIIKFLVFAGLFLSLGVRSQTVIPTSSYTPRYNFQVLDNKQIWNVLADLYQLMGTGSITAVISGTASVKDNTADTLNNRLGSIRSAMYSSSVSLADWAASQDSKLNSIVNQNAVMSVYLDSIANGVNEITYQFTVDATVTYSATGAAIIGTNSVRSLSVNLGSDFWTIKSAQLLDLGNNYGANCNILLLSDTIAAVDNKTFTYTQVRARKVQGYLASTISNAMSNAIGAVRYFGASSAYFPTLGYVTGVVYFLPCTGTSPIGLSGQRLVYQFVFSRNKH